MKSIHQRAITISQSILLFMWTYAALSKLIDFELNLQQMRNQVFPLWMSNLLTYLVPISELAIVTLLLVKKTQWLGFASSAFLLISFTIYILYILLNFSSRVPCSCGGIISSLSWTQHFFFNIAFLGLSLFGLIYHFKQERRLLGNIR